MSCCPTHTGVPLQALLALASGGMEAAALGRANWAAVPATLPVLSLAFVYQNIVPVISSDLEVCQPRSASHALHNDDR